MVLEDVCLLAADTTRTKAYIQNMIKNNILPSKCVFYSENQNAPKNSNSNDIENNLLYFDIKKPILDSLREANIPTTIVLNCLFVTLSK